MGVGGSRLLQAFGIVELANDLEKRVFGVLTC
jgi:hypothetical protein